MNKIKIDILPSCTWSLRDKKFQCNHDYIEISDIHYQFFNKYYICVDCGKLIANIPNEEIAEDRLFNIINIKC